MNESNRFNECGRPATGLMVQEERDGLPLLRFPMLSAGAGLRHAVFTRKGGTSRGPFSELNVGLGAGDRPDRVWENRKRIQNAMGGGRPVFLRQRHGVRVVLAGNGSSAPALADAVITDRPEDLLVIQVADCQAVIVHDPVRRVVANIHSGWRGSIGDIIGKTVATMQQRFGCRPQQLMAGVGPSLGPCCAEFIHYRKEIPPALWRYRIDENHFDFWSMSVDQLSAAGVAGRRIEVAGLCTRCRTDLFYSYRGEKTTGRFAVVAGLALGEDQRR
jgi:YfiH family protein